jgi:hypothetical protein
MTKPVTAAPWSYSKLKAFETCPKQFYHAQVLKQFPFEETEAMRYGTEFHKAAEDFVRDGTPIPGKFSFATKTLEKLKAKPGEKLCERKMGLTENLEPCDFFSKDVWFRGIADLVILDGDLAWVVDYKTGKSSKYADKGQLELMALAIFAHFPQVKRIKAGLMFVIAKDLVKGSYTDFDKDELWRKWLAKHGAMKKAFEVEVWNPRPSGLCRRHCPVTECPHNGAN